MAVQQSGISVKQANFRIFGALMNNHSYLNMVGPFPGLIFTPTSQPLKQGHKEWGGWDSLQSTGILYQQLRHQKWQMVSMSQMQQGELFCWCPAAAMTVLRHWQEGNSQLLIHKKVTEFQMAPTQIPGVSQPATIGADSISKLTVILSCFWTDLLKCQWFEHL